MDVRDEVAEYESMLFETAGQIYQARQSFLTENFDGYVEDTYYVPDSGYFCWPAQINGVFEAYDELLPDEKQALIKLQQEEFEVLGSGVSRIVCAFPGNSELVVKFGRCGMGEYYGTGRKDNITEYQISNNYDIPVLPCYYCETWGEFAIYPRAQPVFESEISKHQREKIQRSVKKSIPSIDSEELIKTENLCWWKNSLYTLDYCLPTDIDVFGTPEYIDEEELIKNINNLRKNGKKKDFKDGGGIHPSAI